MCKCKCKNHSLIMLYVSNAVFFNLILTVYILSITIEDYKLYQNILMLIFSIFTMYFLLIVSIFTIKAKKRANKRRQIDEFNETFKYDRVVFKKYDPDAEEKYDPMTDSDFIYDSCTEHEDEY